MRATTEYARLRIGNRFISPEEISDLYGCNYKVEDIENLAGTFPSKETIDHLSVNNYFLVAGPWEPLCCYTIAGLNHDFIEGIEIGHYCTPIFLQEKIGARWIAISGVMDNSESGFETSDAQKKKLKTHDKRFPTLTEALWVFSVFMVLHRHRSGTELPFESFRTSTISRMSNKVVIFNKNNKLGVTTGCPDNYKMSLLPAFDIF